MITSQARGDKTLFRTTFDTPASVAAQRITTVGAPAIDKGVVIVDETDQVTFTTPWHHRSSFHIMVRFTPTFAVDDGVDHYFFDTTTGDQRARMLLLGDDLRLYLGNELLLVVADTAVQANWNVGAINTIIVSGTSGDTSVWLNGTLVADSDVSTFTCGWAATTTYIGGRNDGAANEDAAGTYHEFLIGDGVLTDEDAAALYGNGIESTEAADVLRPEEALVWLPMHRQQGQTSAGDPSKTPNIGSLGSAADAFLGSDGETAAEVPTLLSPKGFSFDGADDLLTIPDSDGLSFGDGSSDSPFSIACFCRFTDAAESLHICGKGILNQTGEYAFYKSSGRLYFIVYDESVASCYLARYVADVTPYLGLDVVWTATYDPTLSLDARCKIYVDGMQVDDNNGGSNQGSYVAMESLAADLLVGAKNTTRFEGNIYGFAIFPRLLTPRQVSRLSAEWRSRMQVAG